VIVPITVVDIKFDFTIIDHDYAITSIGENTYRRKSGLRICNFNQLSTEKPLHLLG